MSLAGWDTRTPRVLIDVTGGPIELSGNDLTRSLMKFVYNEVPKSKPKVRLEFDNSSGMLFNYGVLIIGLKLKIRFGYDRYMSPPFSVPIDRIQAMSIGEPGKPVVSPHPDVYGTVAMEGYAYPYKAHKSASTDEWRTTGPMTLPQIAKALALKMGFSTSKIFVQDKLDDGTAPDKQVYIEIPAVDTVSTFLQQRAQDIGFEFYISKNEFHFHTNNWQDYPVETIEYFKGPDLLSFEVDGDYTTNVTKAHTKGINPSTGKRIAWLFDSQGMNARVIYGPLGSQTPKDTISKTDIIPALSKKARIKGIKRVLNHVHNKWRLRMSMVGDPVLYMGRTLELANFGQVVDGHWYIREVEHVIDTNGYTTNLVARGRKRGGGGAGGCGVNIAFIFDKHGQNPRVIGGTQRVCSSKKKGRRKKPQTVTVTSGIAQRNRRMNDGRLRKYSP